MNESIHDTYVTYPIGFWDENSPVYSLSHERYFNTLHELNLYCDELSLYHSDLYLVLCDDSNGCSVPTQTAAIIWDT